MSAAHIPENGSRSPSSNVSTASKVSSTVSSGQNRPRPRQGEETSQQVPMDLVQRLAQAESELRGQSGPSSTADSEERDRLALAAQAEEEWEKRSNTGSSVAIRESGGSHDGDGDPAFRKGVPSEDEPVSSSSSSQQHRTNTDLWKQLTDGDEKTEKDESVKQLKEIMAHMVEKHGLQLSDVERQLKRSLKKDVDNTADRESLREKILQIEAKYEAKLAATQEKVVRVQQEKAAVEERKDDLLDRIASVEAKSQQRVQNVKEEMAAQGERLEQQKMQEVKKRAEQAAIEEKKHSEKKIRATAVIVKSVVDERDLLRRNIENAQVNHQAEVQSLKETLATMKVHIRRQQNAAGSVDAGPMEDDVASTKKVLDLSEELALSRETHREMSDELSELRLQMMGMVSGHAAQVGDLRMLLDANDIPVPDEGSLPASSAPATLGLGGSGKGGGGGANVKAGLNLPGMRRNKAPRGKGKGKGKSHCLLSCIDEDETPSMDGSISASGNVSSDADDEVGNLTDFDDQHYRLPTAQLSAQDIQQMYKEELKQEVKQEFAETIDCLKAQTSQAKTEVHEAKVEMVGNEAMLSNKVARLKEVLKTTREAEVEEAVAAEVRNDREEWVEAKLQDLHSDLIEQKTHSEAVEAENESLRLQIQCQQQQDGGEMEDLRQQLFCALEAKRMAESRVEEFKRAMALLERQHNEVVADLKQQLLVFNGGVGPSRGDDGSDCTGASPGDEQEDLRQQLRCSVEERNVLSNSLEWKEVQWKSKVENLEMQQAAEIAEIKRKGEKEKETALRLEAELAEVRQQLEEVQAAARAQAELVQPQPPAAPAVATGSWLSVLRCPVRNLPGGQMPSSPDSVAYCQDVCWRILNSIQGITALICTLRDYKVVEATRTACMTWGSAALFGQSVLTLVNGPSRAAWLRKAFQMHQNIADTQNEGVPGFVVRDLGCEEFTTKTGQVFDSSVITAHLPAEPRCGKDAALLVIIEPQDSAARAPPSNAPAAQPVVRGSDHRVGNQSSAHSEVSTVDPSDSASNIFDRNTGMFSRG